MARGDQGPFHAIGDPAGLVPRERDGRTGRRARGPSDRQQKDQRSPHPASPRSRRAILVGAAVAVAVILIAGIAIASGGDESQVATVSPGISSTSSPSTGATTSTLRPTVPTSVAPVGELTMADVDASTVLIHTPGGPDVTLDSPQGYLVTLSASCDQECTLTLVPGFNEELELELDGGRFAGSSSFAGATDRSCPGRGPAELIVDLQPTIADNSVTRVVGTMTHAVPTFEGAGLTCDGFEATYDVDSPLRPLGG